MQLTPEQVSRYERDGHLFLEGVFSAEEASMLRCEADVVFASGREEVWREDNGAPRTALRARVW